MVGRLGARPTSPNVSPCWQREPRDRSARQALVPVLASNEARTHETVTRTRPEIAMRPDENRSPEHQPQARRIVRLPAPDEPAQPVVPPARQFATPAGATANDRLLRVAEQVVGDWAPTLREAALRVVLFTLVLIAVGV